MPIMRIFVVVLAALAFFAVIPAAKAEEKIKIDEVVVTATRYEEKVADVPANVTYITEESIRNSTAQNIPDLLRTQTGILVNDINGSRRTYTVDLRGFGETSPSNTLVLVDGRRVNQADLSGVDWVEIPLDRVSRIEIIRGGRGSVLYGDNAAGGVINIITKEGTSGFKAGAGLAGGSFSTFKADSYVSGGMKNLSLHLSGNYLSSDGFRDNSKTESKDLGFNAAYYLRDFLKMDFSVGYHKDHSGLPGALKESDFAAGASRNDTRFPNDFAETKDYYLKLSPEVLFSENAILRIDTSFRKRDFQSFSSGDYGHFLGDSGIQTTILSPQVILRHRLGGMKNTLTAGIDYQRSASDIVNDSLFFGAHTVGMFDLKKVNDGYYGHDEISVTDSLRLSAGFRYDHARFSFSPSTPESISMKKNAYTAGVNYTFFRKSYAYASYSRSFRYPLLDELYSFFTNSVNTGLGPQTSNDYELGVRHYLSDDLFMHVNVFRLDTDREIFFNPVTYQNENLDGKTRRDGVELSVEAKATSQLTVRGSYTYLTAKIKEGAFTGKEIPNAPAHKATLDVTYQISKAATAGVTGIYVGERPFVSDFANDFSKQESYLILNAKLSYRWKSVRAFVDLNNLTNKSYSEYGVLGGFPLEKAFYPSPRRNFLVGLSFDI